MSKPDKKSSESSYSLLGQHMKSIYIAPVKGEANIRAIESMANIKANPEDTEKELREIFHLDK